MIDILNPLPELLRGSSQSSKASLVFSKNLSICSSLTSGLIPDEIPVSTLLMSSTKVSKVLVCFLPVVSTFIFSI